MGPAFDYNKILAFATVLHPQTLHVPSSLSLDRFAVAIWNLGAFECFETLDLWRFEPLQFRTQNHKCVWLNASPG